MISAVVFVIFAFSSCETVPAPPPPQEPGELTKVVIGYYYSGTRAEFDHTKIQYRYLTHIAHAFAWPDASGNLFVPDGLLYPELVQTAHENDVRVIISLGGWGHDEGFPVMASTPANRARFIAQLLDFCLTNGYDGVDLDWEFVSNAEEQQNFVQLVQELSAALKSQDTPLLLTMAAPAGNYWGRWIDFEVLSGEFDFIGFMTYDYHGSWSDHSGHNSPLYACNSDGCGSVSETYYYALSRLVPLEKLLLGIPFFGKSFDCGGLSEEFTTCGSYDYKDIIPLRPPEWVLLRDECAQVPFLRKTDGAMIISFDDRMSVAAKCRYVLDKQAAGVIIWELSGDEWNGKSELLEVIGRSFSVR
jgi:chitinase